jgi:hypothetical protein
VMDPIAPRGQEGGAVSHRTGSKELVHVMKGVREES